MIAFLIKQKEHRNAIDKIKKAAAVANERYKHSFRGNKRYKNKRYPYNKHAYNNSRYSYNNKRYKNKQYPYNKQHPYNKQFSYKNKQYPYDKQARLARASRILKKHKYKQQFLRRPRSLL
jgi:hypothetical protein